MSERPVILTFAIRMLKFLLGFFLIAPVVHIAEHIGGHDSAQRLQGALTLLLIFWFMGLLKEEAAEERGASK